MSLVNKTFSDIITFTRTSQATYFDATGTLQVAANNVPRLDYDPSTLAPRGLLIEEQRTNLLTQTQSFRTKTLTVTIISGTFQDGETVTSIGGGGSGKYVSSESTATSFAIYNSTGNFSGTLTGTTSLATATINVESTQWHATNCQLSIPINSQLAPNGSLSAQVISPTTAGIAVRSVRQVYTTTTTDNYTFSVFVKRGTGPTNNLIALFIRDQTSTNNTFANFNMSTLAIPTPTVTGGSWIAGTPTVTQINKGWVRLSISVTTNTAFSSLTSEVYMGGYQGSVDTIGDFYIWGAQLEAGAFPTSYIPTAAIQSIREPDVASVNTLSPWYNQGNGTLYGEFLIPPNLAVFPGSMASLSDGTQNNQVAPYAYINGLYATIRTGGAPQGDPSVLATPVVGALAKFAIALEANNCVAAWNGTVGTVDTSVALPTVNQLRLGTNGAGTGPSNSWLRRLTYYPRRLSSAELTAITT